MTRQIKQTLMDDGLDNDGLGDFWDIVSPMVGSAHPTAAVYPDVEPFPKHPSTRSADLIPLPAPSRPAPIAPPLPP